MNKTLFLLTLLVPAMIMATSADWPSVHGNQYLTANNDEIVPSEGNINWTFNAPANIYYPVPVQDKILLSSLDHNVYCLDMHKGTLLWKHQTSAPLIRSIVVKGDHVIVPSGSVIRDLSIRSGELLWARDEQPNNIYIYPIIVNDKIIYGTRKTMICRELETGKLVWNNNNINIFGGSATAFDNIVVVQSRHYAEKKYTVAALDLRNGRLLWENEICPDSNIFTPVIYNKDVFVSSKNILYSLSLSSGKQNWAKELNDNIASECVFANGNLHFAAEGGFIVIVDPQTGDTVETVSFRPGRLPFSIVGENMFVLEYASGSIFKIDLTDYRKTIFLKDEKNVAGGHQMAIADGNIFFPKNSVLFAVGEHQPDMLIASTKNRKMLSGKITDENGNPVNAEIYIPDSGKKVLATDGHFSIPIPEKGFPVRLDLTASNMMYKTVMVDKESPDVAISMDRVSKEKSFSLDNIYFDFDRADLKPSAIPVILNVKQFLQKNPGVRLEILGHTDSEGEETYNLELSQRRADRVKQFLVKNEIKEDRLSSLGMGEKEPISDNTTTDGKRLNRRIEFVVR